MAHRPSRRELLESGVALGAVAASGCQASAEVTRGVCFHDCPDACAWTVTRRQGKLISITADAAHPYTRGELCPRMDNYLEDIVHSPDRLLYPLRRSGAKGGSSFQKVSWDSALDDVASRLKAIIAKHGPTAILPYSYAGTEGLVQMNSLSARLFARLGATRLERAICGDAGSEGVKATLGATTGILPADIVHSRYILVWGANPAVTAPHSWHFAQEAKRGGARIVTIDPQRTATAAASDWHLQPLPGTDAALALGLMHVIIQESLHDAAFVDQHTVGFDKLRERAAAFPPDRVAAITGLAAKDIIQLAREYAKAGVSTIRLLVGMEHRANGAMAYRAISCLPALTGAWRHLGGGLSYMTYELFPLNYDAVTMPQLENPKIRQVNMAQLGRALTSPEMNPAIHALIVYNSNPATIAPHQNLVLQGLRREDLFTVVVEQFLTDTARHADYIFPAATQVEQLDLLGSWGQNWISLNTPAAPPLGEAVPNTEFFRRLAKRMGLEDSYLFDSDEQILRAGLNTKNPNFQGITYERLQKEGRAPLNLPRPWMPYAKGTFPTPSGKCEFYSETWAKKGLDPLPAYTPATDVEGPKYPLRLLTSKSATRFLNSSHAGVKRAKLAEGGPQASLHPLDAAPRGIANGDLVEISNNRGKMLATAKVTPGVKAGVVAMPHGWWASTITGKSSPNALTRDGLSDAGGGGDFHDTRVQVAKA